MLKLYGPVPGCMLITGTTYIRFIVEKDGSLKFPEIVRSSGDKFLDKEAIRIINETPEWIPAKHKGVPVRFSYILPLRFRPF